MLLANPRHLCHPAVHGPTLYGCHYAGVSMQSTLIVHNKSKCVCLEYIYLCSCCCDLPFRKMSAVPPLFTTSCANCSVTLSSSVSSTETAMPPTAVLPADSCRLDYNQLMLMIVSKSLLLPVYLCIWVRVCVSVPTNTITLSVDGLQGPTK